MLQEIKQQHSQHQWQHPTDQQMKQINNNATPPNSQIVSAESTDADGEAEKSGISLQEY